jgi:protein-tyrosine phosphatase
MRSSRPDNSQASDGPEGSALPVFVDVHCHCLPGLDDGPADQAEALALCEALVADHIGTVVATPHQLGRYDGLYDAQRVREAVGDLNRMLAEAQLPLNVLPGADVRVDERIAELIASDQILTVGDAGRYLLLELPHEIFIDPALLLAQLAANGIGVVITHPERHRFLAQRPQYVEQWAPHKPSLQITAGSLLGGFGRLSEQAAWAFLDAPMPVLVATDAHAMPGRAPRMTDAYRALVKQLGRDAADILCVENPKRLLAGHDLLMLDAGRS